MAIKSSVQLKKLFPATWVRTLAFTMLLILSSTLCFATTTPQPTPPAVPHIVFLNPGEPVDRGKGMFWPMTARKPLKPLRVRRIVARCAGGFLWRSKPVGT